MGLVQSKSAASISATFDSPVISGNLVVVHIRTTTTSANQPSTPTDGTNTYNIAANLGFTATNSVNTSQWYAYNVVGSASFTVTDMDAEQIVIEEYNGVIATDPFDKKATATGAGQSTSTNTAVLSQENELVIGTIGGDTDDSFTIGAGFSSGTTVPAVPNALLATEYKIVSSSAAVAATFNSVTTTTSVLCCTYKVLVVGTLPKYVKVDNRLVKVCGKFHKFYDI